MCLFPIPQVELETCVISSDDEDYVQQVTKTTPQNSVNLKQDTETPKAQGSLGRRNIREVMDEQQLSRATREANAAENARRQRIMELQKKYNQFDKQIAVSETTGGRCVIEYSLETKEPLVEVHPSLAHRMKEHQKDGIKFLYRNLVETVAKLKENSPGTGAILAHCMGTYG